MEAIMDSQSKLYWRKLGKWQSLVCIMTLAIFFITLHITGDKNIAFTVVGAVATVGIVVAVAFTTFTVVAAVAALATLAGATFAALTFTAFTVVAAGATVGIVALVADELKKNYGLRKVITITSFLVEFLIILLPLLTH